MTGGTYHGARSLRATRTAIIGFGPVAQAHCLYHVSGVETDDSSILTVFPGIHDTPGDTWPPDVTDLQLVKAIKSASILFVEESVSSIQLVPGRKGGGYIVETSQHSYAFREIWLEPADSDIV